MQGGFAHTKFTKVRTIVGSSCHSGHHGDYAAHIWGDGFYILLCSEDVYSSPLTSYQRGRVVVVVCAWVAISISLSPVYFGLGDILGMRLKTSGAIFERSYCSGSCLCSASTRGLESFFRNLSKGSVMSET